jgi:hypothetical protein
MIPVIAVASRVPDPKREPYYRFPEFLRSVRRFGNEPIILGNKGDYHGLLSRGKLLRNHLREHPEYDWVIWSDAFDVIFIQSPEFIVKQAKETGSPTCINTERNCWPRQDWAVHFNQSEPYPYLNTGFIVGKARAILELLEESNCENDVDYKGPDGKWVHFSEQENIMEAAIKRNFRDIHLDTKGEICLTLVGAPDDEVAVYENRIYNVHRCNWPSVVHCNGSKSNPNWERTLKWFESIP